MRSLCTPSRCVPQCHLFRLMQLRLSWWIVKSMTQTLNPVDQIELLDANEHDADLEPSASD